MQPSKSHYHCNGTDGVGGEEMGVWEGERDEVVLLSSVSLPLSQEKCVNPYTHIYIPLSYCHCNGKLGGDTPMSNKCLPEEEKCQKD